MPKARTAQSVKSALWAVIRLKTGKKTGKNDASEHSNARTSNKFTAQRRISARWAVFRQLVDAWKQVHRHTPTAGRHVSRHPAAHESK